MKKLQKEKLPFIRLAYLTGLFSISLLSACVEIKIPMPGEMPAPKTNKIQKVSAPKPTMKQPAVRRLPSMHAGDKLKCLVVYSPLSIEQDKSLEAEKARDAVNRILKERGIETHNKILAKVIERDIKTYEFTVPDEELKARAKQRGVNCLTIFHLEWGPDNLSNAQTVFRAKAYNVTTGKLLGITEKFGQASAMQNRSRDESPWEIAAVRAAYKGTNALIKNIVPRKQASNLSGIYTLIFTGFNETEMDGIYETISEMNHSKVSDLNYEPLKLQIKVSRPNSNSMQVKLEIKNRFRQLNFPLRTKLVKGNQLHFVRDIIR